MKKFYTTLFAVFAIARFLMHNGPVARQDRSTTLAEMPSAAQIGNSANKTTTGCTHSCFGKEITKADKQKMTAI